MKATLKNSNSIPQKSDNYDLKINLKKWFSRIISNWWLFLIGLAITIPVGQFYLKNIVPLYSTKAKLLIRGVGSGNGLSGAAILAEGLGIEEGGKNMDNEIEILRSRPIVTKVIEKIEADITYFKLGAYRNTELYKASPIQLSNYQLRDGRTQLIFYLEPVDDSRFKFKTSEDDEGEVQYYNKPFQNQLGSFTISLNRVNPSPSGIYQVNIMDAEDVANDYKGTLEIEVIGSQGASGILELKLLDQSPQKARDFINTLIKVYNSEEVNENTEVLKMTIHFIDERIERLTSELREIEADIEKFKSDNDIINETASASLNFSLLEMRNALTELSSFEVQEALLTALEENLSKDKNELIPTNVSGVNESLGEVITEYNSTFLERRALAETISEESPVIIQLDNKLNDIKSLVKVTLQNLKRDLQIPLTRTRTQIDKLKSNLMGVPAVERQLLEKVRTQSVKEGLYLFLLQKKEETELSQAVTNANTRVIESARSTKGPVYPQKKLVLIGTMLLGLVLPFGVVVLRVAFESTVDSEEALKEITSAPIIGRIAHFKSSDKKVIDPKERSIKAEMFRLLRTNLTYLNVNKEQQIVGITSSMSGEGKTTIAINLGAMLATSGKKVALVDMDLRKPKVSEYLETKNEQGVTSYLANQSKLEDIINIHYESGLHYIPSGPIPPNPAELILSEQMQSFMGELKKTYDIIILDAPPIGVVSDGLLLRDYLTNTLYVVRHKYTKKAILKYMEELNQNDDLVNPSIVINDIKTGGKGGSYNGYNSTYGAGYYLNK